MAIVESSTVPDREISRTLRTFPRGIERLEIRLSRISDYFDHIEVVPDEESLSIKMIFHVRDNVDSFWKNIVVAILRAVADKLPGASAIPVCQPTRKKD